MYSADLQCCRFIRFTPKVHASHGVNMAPKKRRAEASAEPAPKKGGNRPGAGRKKPAPGLGQSKEAELQTQRSLKTLLGARVQASSSASSSTNAAPAAAAQLSTASGPPSSAPDAVNAAADPVNATDEQPPRRFESSSELHAEVDSDSDLD